MDAHLSDRDTEYYIIMLHYIEALEKFTNGAKWLTSSEGAAANAYVLQFQPKDDIWPPPPNPDSEEFKKHFQALQNAVQTHASIGRKTTAEGRKIFYTYHEIPVAADAPPADPIFVASKQYRREKRARKQILGHSETAKDPIPKEKTPGKKSVSFSDDK